MAGIRVTPETLSGQGNELIDYASDLSEILGLIDSKVNQITEGWEGMAQNAYFSMYESMKKSLDQFPELVNTLGSATVSAAEAFASVDEELQKGFSSAT